MFSQELPAITSGRIDGKLTLLSGKELIPDLLKLWQEIILQIERFFKRGCVSGFHSDVEF